MSEGKMSRFIILSCGVLALAWTIQHFTGNELHDLMASQSVSAAFERPQKQGPFVSSIEFLGSTAGTDGDTLLLQATVTSEKLVAGAHVHWVLPNDVELVSGESRQTVAIIAPNAPFRTQITVRELGPGNKLIRFMAAGSAGGSNYTVASQYNTANDGILRAQKEQLLRSIESSPQNKKAMIH